MITHDNHHVETLNEIRDDVVQMRQIAFGIEEALKKTPRGISIESPKADFIRRMLFDYADTLDLKFDA